MTDTILWESESDNYSRRANFCFSESRKNEPICKLFSKLSPPKAHVLDIGCAYGELIWALSELRNDCTFEGIDPGLDSIKKAKESPKHNFEVSYSHNLPQNNEIFDAVILCMVLQWIPRSLFIRTISEIDRVLKPGGLIFVQDFLPNKPVTSQSRHNPEVMIFKDNYARYFEAFPWFKEIHRTVLKIDEGEDQQRCISVLKKYELSQVYTEKPGAIENKGN